MKKYNGRPRVICPHLEILPSYGLNVLYLPIKMAGSFEFKVPDSLRFLMMPIYFCLDEVKDDHYVYLSYECSWVNKGTPQKRPGIHCDGFMTNDVNFIWSDKDPTLFFDQDFEIFNDHRISMEQFEAQADRNKVYSFNNKALLRLDERVAHEVAIPTESGVRQFFKLSISKDKYNLKGNTHNPLFEYNWVMHERSVVRNHPVYKEADSVPLEFPA